MFSGIMWTVQEVQSVAHYSLPSGLMKELYRSIVLAHFRINGDVLPAMYRDSVLLDRLPAYSEQYPTAYGALDPGQPGQCHVAVLRIDVDDHVAHGLVGLQELCGDIDIVVREYAVDSAHDSRRIVVYMQQAMAAFVSRQCHLREVDRMRCWCRCRCNAPVFPPPPCRYFPGPRSCCRRYGE